MSIICSAATIISIVVSSIAALAAIVSAICASISSSYVKVNNEMKIREMIAQAYNIFVTSYEENKNSRGLICENYLNTLNLACGLYLRKKVRKKHFEKDHMRDIARLYTNDIFYEYLDIRKNNYPNLTEVILKWKVKYNIQFYTNTYDNKK